MLAGLAIATIAGAAWFSMSTTDESIDNTSTAPSPVAESGTATDLDLAPQDVSSPIVAPIDDASEVVAQIDDNTEEAAALDLLGLDEAGNLIGVGHRYTWSSSSGATMTTTVDDATGNYAFESSDGLEWRMVDGTSYSRRDDLAWAQVDDDAFESVQRLGLDGPVTVEQILDPLTAEYASSITLPDDGTTSMSAEIDEYGLWSDYPEERRIWLGLMGITNPIETVEPDSIIVIAASMAADGRTVNTFTVTTSDVASTYTLDEVFDTTPAIEVPAR